MKLIAELELNVKYRFEKEFKDDNEFMDFLKRNALLNQGKVNKFEFDDDELIAIIPDYGEEIGQDVDDFMVMFIDGEDDDEVILADGSDEITEYINDIPEPKEKDAETLEMFNENGEVISREE